MAGDTDCRYSNCDGSLGISSVVRLRENEVDYEASQSEKRKDFAANQGATGNRDFSASSQSLISVAPRAKRPFMTTLWFIDISNKAVRFEFNN